MAKAILHPNPRQAAEPRSGAVPRPLGPTFLTPDCRYSIVNGLLYCELVHDLWFPGHPLLLSSEIDYRPAKFLCPGKSSSSISRIKTCSRVVSKYRAASLSDKYRSALCRVKTTPIYQPIAEH